MLAKSNYREATRPDGTLGFSLGRGRGRGRPAMLAIENESGEGSAIDPNDVADPVGGEYADASEDVPCDGDRSESECGAGSQDGSVRDEQDTDPACQLQWGLFVYLVAPHVPPGLA